MTLQKLIELVPCKGFLTYLSGIGIFLIGAAATIGQVSVLVGLVGQCLAGQVDLSACMTQVPQIGAPLLVTLSGSAIVGLRRALGRRS